MIERRHTNRRDFFDEDVPPDVIYELTTAAEQEEPSDCGASTRWSQRSYLRGRGNPERRSALSSRQLGHGRPLTSIGPTNSRSTQFRIPMPVPSLRLWFQRRRCRKGMAAETEAVKP